MAITTKKILIALGIGVLIIVTPLAVALGWAIYRSFDKEASRAYEAKEAEGREFGKTTDQLGCMKEGLARAKDPSINFSLNNGAFVRTCLESSRPVPGFCDGVPRRTLLNPQDYEWTAEQCQGIGMDDRKTDCSWVFHQQVQFCGAR